MSWWGKVLGGAFGFMLGGPLGAMIGVALGHNFDKGLRGLDDDVFAPGDQERVQMAFFTATFATMGHVAKVDGAVSHDEISMAESVMTQMDLSPDMRRAAINLFDQGKQQDFPLEEVIEQFRRECTRRQNLMRMFVEIQLQAAYADGSLHAAEDELLRRVCQMLGIPEAVYRQMENLVRASVRGGAQGGYSQHGQNRGGGYRPQPAASMTKSDARALLGVDTNTSDADLKKAYRRLMSQHHPDKLVAKGLPEEMIKLATEKTQKIREAYELLTKR
ncbi:MAG: co-chaperone DjlA [Pseudomonadota bacterium]